MSPAEVIRFIKNLVSSNSTKNAYLHKMKSDGNMDEGNIVEVKENWIFFHNLLE